MANTALLFTMLAIQRHSRKHLIWERKAQQQMAFPIGLSTSVLLCQQMDAYDEYPELEGVTKLLL